MRQGAEPKEETAMIEREISITFPTPKAALSAKYRLRANGVHAWIESTDTTSIRSMQETATQVVICDHHPEVGPIEPIISRILQ